MTIDNIALGDFPFEYLYDLSQWNFYIGMLGKNAYLDCILKITTVTITLWNIFSTSINRRIAPDLA